LLGDVWRLFDPHWQSVVLIISERGADSAQLLGVIIQFECVVLHGKVQCAEKLVMVSFPENVMNAWQVVYPARNHGVENILNALSIHGIMPYG
jgi:hypothetical protein